MKTFLNLTITILSFFLFLGSNIGYSQTSHQLLINKIKEGALLVDVRTPEEYTAGSLIGAVNIPLDQITKQLNKFKSMKSIVVFCRSGRRSKQAQIILKQNKINNVLDGGSIDQLKPIVPKLK